LCHSKDANHNHYRLFEFTLCSGPTATALFRVEIEILLHTQGSSALAPEKSAGQFIGDFVTLEDAN
jgi:hypothetical protein